MTALSAMRASPASLRRAAGFTLMEIMVVIIIVGILATIALPSYQESMRKGRRTDAKQALMDVANREEQYMLDQSTYTDDLTKLGYPASPMLSENKYYSIKRVADNVSGANCAVTATTCYVLRATPATGSPQADDKRCTSFTLDSTGAQTATGSDSTNCW
jgi:type IV pilus assembly protein PilE